MTIRFWAITLLTILDVAYLIYVGQIHMPHIDWTGMAWVALLTLFMFGPVWWLANSFINHRPDKHDD